MTAMQYHVSLWVVILFQKNKKKKSLCQYERNSVSFCEDLGTEAIRILLYVLDGFCHVSQRQINSVSHSSENNYILSHYRN